MEINIISLLNFITKVIVAVPKSNTMLFEENGQQRMILASSNLSGDEEKAPTEDVLRLVRFPRVKNRN